MLTEAKSKGSSYYSIEQKRQDSPETTLGELSIDSIPSIEDRRGDSPERTIGELSIGTIPSMDSFESIEQLRAGYDESLAKTNPR